MDAIAVGRTAAMNEYCHHNNGASHCMECAAEQLGFRPSVPVVGSTCDDYTPPSTYRRWQFSCTLDVWALPLCITRYKCGGVVIQFLCFEALTDRAHRWPIYP
jgi:hypothetical protein